MNKNDKFFLFYIFIMVVFLGAALLVYGWLDVQKWSIGSYEESKEFQANTTALGISDLSGMYNVKYCVRYGKKIPGDATRGLRFDCDNVVQQTLYPGDPKEGLYAYDGVRLSFLFERSPWQYAIPRVGLNGKIYLIYNKTLILEKQ